MKHKVQEDNMKRFTPARLRVTVGATAVAAVMMAPAAAHAGQDYVVSLKPAAEQTCADTLAGVTRDYSISPRSTYTSSLCGFSASLSRRTVDALRLDPRVGAVSSDGYTSGV